MPRIRFHRSILLSVCASAMFAAGCSPGTVTVSGKLVFPPTVKLNDTDTVTIGFVPESPGGKGAFGAYSGADKTFVASNVVPGKYKISVKLQPYMGQGDNKKRSGAFETLNRMAEGEKSKLSYEVTSDAQQSITVDLDKGTVTKN